MSPVKPVKQLPAPNNVTPISAAYTPPANPEAEQSVLGAILVRPGVLDLVAVLITPADFYREAHGNIYQAMLDLRDSGKPVDLVTVTALLKERGKLEGAGGPVFLAGLSEQVGFATNAEYYARVVKDKARLRRFIDKTQAVTGAAFGPQENVSEFLETAAQEILDSTGSAHENEAVSLQTMVETQSSVVEQQFYEKEPTGIPVGYLDLGRLISWEPGDLIILAARPSMGKTALALNFMLKVAAAGSHAGIITLETSKEKLTRRFMSIIGRINGHRMNQGRLQASEWVQFVKLREQVEGLPIWIDDTPSLNIAEIRARARNQRKAGQLDFLVVDYLQLAKPLKRGRSREEEVAELSRGLKSLAKELNIPVLAVSALNRKFAERTNKRPQRSDLRESGAIEFDADKIMFLYREEEDKPNDDKVRGIAELDVDKHKDGPTGKVKLAFQKEFFRFEDLAQ
jgi:replicative DNA helicase